MALRTWDGSTEPAEQADPLEAQIPCKSSAANKAMLSVPSTANETVFANRDAAEPIT